MNVTLLEHTPKPDHLCGLMSVPYVAVKSGRYGMAKEPSPDYFRDGVGYLNEADAERDAPTLFDFFGGLMK